MTNDKKIFPDTSVEEFCPFEAQSEGIQCKVEMEALITYRARMVMDDKEWKHPKPITILPFVSITPRPHSPRNFKIATTFTLEAILQSDPQLIGEQFIEQAKKLRAVVEEYAKPS